MERDTVIRLALEAGADMYSSDRVEFWVPRLERFAALVAAAEREECAKVCERLADKFFENAQKNDIIKGAGVDAAICAIRSRS